MDQNTRWIATGGKHIPVSFGCDCEDCPARNDKNSNAKNSPFELLWVGIWKDRKCAAKYEELIFPYAIKLLREKGASLRINDEGGFMLPLMQRVETKVCIKDPSSNKRWPSNHYIKQKAIDAVSAYHLLNEAHHPEFLLPAAYYMSEECGDCPGCEIRPDRYVIGFSKRVPMLQKIANSLAVSHPDFEYWSDEFIEMFADHIELDLAEEVLARKNTDGILYV